MLGAVPTRLGEVVRFFSEAPPWSPEGGVMRVCLGAADLADVPEGSRMLLRIRVEEIPYLNVIRPYFAERRPRAVFWVDEATFRPLRSHAPDLFSFVFRIVEVPPRRWPEFAEQGVRAAIDAGVPFAWDGERAELEALLGEVGWEGNTVDLRTSMSFREQLRALEKPGLPVVEGIERPADSWRVRMALARAGREGAWVALRPSMVPAGMWRLHARQADVEDATTKLRAAGWEQAGAMAAWLDLEPERIEEAIGRVGQAPVDPAQWPAERVAMGDGPVHVLRMRIGDADVTEAREQLRSGHVPEDAMALAVWSEGAEPWRDDAVAWPEARLVRCLRCLGEGTPSVGSVDAAAKAGLGDVAAELGRIRFEHGADARADQAVKGLWQYGEVEQARRIAEAWKDRARAAADHESLAMAQTWLGDFCLAQGAGEDARWYYEGGVDIRRGLVAREPNRSDLQRDLSTSFERLGDLHVVLGRGEQAQRHYEDSLAIRAALVAHDPGDSDLQHGLAIAHMKLGDVQAAQGNIQRAKLHHEDALAIVRMLLEREPNNPELQHESSAFHSRLGSSYAALGNVERARECLEEALAIMRRLADQEPGRTDLERALSISYCELGDLHVWLGSEEQARKCFEASLAITRRLLDREPGRADLERDLSACFNRIGDLHWRTGNGERARRYFEDGLAIVQALLEREPSRSDLRRDLSVWSNRLGSLHMALGNTDSARHFYEVSLAISQALAEQEPSRSDLQGDLALAYEHMAKVVSEEATSWLAKAIDVHRARLSLDPDNAIVQRELAVVLAQLANVSEHRDDAPRAAELRREAFLLLRALDDRGALDARYQSLLAGLAEAQG